MKAATASILIQSLTTPPTGLSFTSSYQHFASSSPPAAVILPSPKVFAHIILAKILDFKSLLR